MTKTELFKAMAQVLRESEHGDYDDVLEYLFEHDINYAKVDSYIHDADDKGFEQWEIYMAETFPGAPEFIHFHFAIAWHGGRWGEAPCLLEVNPYVATRYNSVKDWTND